MARKTKRVADGETPPADTVAATQLGKKTKRRKSARQSAADIKRRERMREALDFRKQGYTYAEIADALEISTTTAFTLVREGMREIPEDAADDVRRLELARLDFMQAQIMPLLAENPESGLIDSILKIMDRRARYLGLHHDDSSSGSIFEAMGARLAEMMAADRPVLRIEAGTPLPANPIL